MIENLKKELKNLAEEKYQKFSAKLTPNTNNILGVRLPILRKLAKKIATSNYQVFFKENDDEFFELTMLEGMIIGYLPNDKQKKYIEKFIPKINNWAICDSFCCGVKNLTKDFLEPYFKSSKEYYLRFAFVILLNYFIDSDYEYVIEKISKFNNEQYYAKMAVAWCLSICIIKNYDKCLKDIQKIEIHPWTKNKGITKAIESLKLTKEQKEELRKIRNKKSS
ncbi:MAG: DNA alkylation repair protein [Candidatus Gastranaerophilales bacterium]|nr:DNA alkylation repair protein [Candidatus Gastranaerophilales bacterium]